MQQKLANERRAPATTTLVVMAATGALAMNIFLPSLPGMARYFDTSYAVVQLTVSLYLAATAVLQLVIGPLSDRYGRKPVLMVALTIFLISTLAAIFAPTIETLIVCRLFQASAAAGMVLSRAIVRDTVNHIDEAASKIGYVTMGMALVPMIGPVIGGVADEAFGWKSTFILTFGFGLLAMSLVAYDLKETNLHRSASLRAQIAAYPELLTSRRFWGYTLTAAFGSGSFFAFLGGGPFVATEMLGLSPSQYALYFAILSFGYMIGNFISGRFSRRIGNNPMMLIGNVLGVFGVLAALVLLWLGYFHAATMFSPIFFVGFGNGMTLPNANAGQVSVRPHLAGSASGLGGTIQISCGAILAFLGAALLSVEAGPQPLFLLMLASSTTAVAASFYVIYVNRKAADRGEL
ncbi:MAG TPA: multidrug effflux MFS transporter [Rhizobiaceae bacterium]|nr:multidrug effflux MFS transporter [Rhizobiaceae bacterium]